MACSICKKDVETPYKTPVNPPFYMGGNHCEECEHWHWLLNGEDTLDG